MQRDRTVLRSISQTTSPPVLPVARIQPDSLHLKSGGVATVDVVCHWLCQCERSKLSYVGSCCPNTMTSRENRRSKAVEFSKDLTIRCHCFLVQLWSSIDGELRKQMDTQPHRNRVKHHHNPGDFHELAFSTYRRMPLLTSDLWRIELSRSIDQANQIHQFELTAFVYMPEHLHLLLFH